MFCSRLAKEKSYYEGESKQEKKRLDDYKEAGKDEHTCKKQVSIY